MFLLNSVILVFLVIANVVSSQTGDSCERCIKCLPQANRRKIFLKYGLKFVFNSGKCPDQDSLEHKYLQQILYIYKGHETWLNPATIPCYNKCSSCYNTIQVQCSEMKPVFWLEPYMSLFYANASHYASGTGCGLLDTTLVQPVQPEQPVTDSEIDAGNTDGEKVKQPKRDDIKDEDDLFNYYFSPNGDFRERVKKSRQKRGLCQPSKKTQCCTYSKDHCCGTICIPEVFEGPIKFQSTTWYAVKLPQYGQYYGEISCCNKEKCVKKRTVRSFLVINSAPIPVCGHSCTLFNPHSTDIRLYSMEVGAYCVTK